MDTCSVGTGKTNKVQEKARRLMQMACRQTAVAAVRPFQVWEGPVLAHPSGK
jgi:hypothetical protein